MSDTVSVNLDAERRVRAYYGRVAEIERAALAAVRMGHRLSRDPAVRAIVAAVLDLPQADRGLAVTGLFVDVDDAHARWLVLIELDGGNRTHALAVPYPQ
jgi:hypothetical protein